MNSKLLETTIHNEFGDTATLLNYGARIKSLEINLGSEKRNIVLGYRDNKDYINDPYYIGATIGRYSNRIKKSRYSTQNTEYILSSNEGKNQLHGGPRGFDKVYWNEKHKSEEHICLEHLSPDGDQGFPGDLLVTVTYSWEADRSLRVSYTAESTKETPVSVTNHSYFNLEQSVNNIYGHFIQIGSEEITEFNPDFTTDGTFASIINTSLDLRQEKSVSELISSDDARIKLAGGADFNYVLNNKAVVILQNSASDLMLRLETNYPGLQLYTGQHLGGPFKSYQAICMEPQFYPCSPNHTHFPNCFIGPENSLNKYINLKFKTFNIS